MLFFRGEIVLRRVMLLVAPLVVCGVVYWQRLTTIERGSEPEAHAQRLMGPPDGISADEWQAAGMDFEGIVDSTFQCAVEEMPAYWRLLKWSGRKSESDSEHDGFRRVAFNELVNRPKAWRGRPVLVDLYVCRVVEYPAPENSIGIQHLYEVWGWSEDSRGSLYVVVTPDLPAGMSVGESVSERATVSGYFYKVQGYVAAGSAAQSLPAAAPLVIGRMSRWNAPVAAFVNVNELWLGGAAVLLAASFLFLLSQSSLIRRRGRQPVRAKAAAKLESWVDSFGADSDADLVPAGALASSP